MGEKNDVFPFAIVRVCACVCAGVPLLERWPFNSEQTRHLSKVLRHLGGRLPGNALRHFNCAAVSLWLAGSTRRLPPKIQHIFLNYTLETGPDKRKLRNNISSFVRQCGLKRLSGSIYYQRGSPQPGRQLQRHQHPTVSQGHICMTVSSSQWSFTAVVRKPGSPSPIASPESAVACQRTSQTRKQTESTWWVGTKLLGGMERVCEAVSRSSRPRGKKKQTNKIYSGGLVFPLHHINIAAPVKLVFKTFLRF